jgi:hypothetical protein
MNTQRINVDDFLSLKRIVMLTLAITFAYYALFILMRYFNRPMFENPIEMEIWDDHGVNVLGADTLQMKEMQALHPMRPPHPEFHEPPRHVFLSKLLVNIPLTFIMVFIVFLYDRKIMSIGLDKKRDEFFAIILGSIFIGMILSSLCIAFQWYGWPSWRPNNPLYICAVKGWLGDLPLYAFAVLSAYLLRSVYLQKKSAVENETLRAENISTRYEALKNQLDPHFLFNSLNTLKSLIEIDVDKAGDFVHQLSTVLRYTLKTEEMVTLAQELDCVRPYCQMMKMRYGDNLIFDHHIDHEKYDNYNVLPLSIQGLIENAIKHNVVSSKQPLTICIHTDDDNHLIVSNKIQPKIGKEEGTGIGLANLSERYRIKWNENVEIFNDGKIFSVTLPLKLNVQSL